jgi:hypothetical protein
MKGARLCNLWLCCLHYYSKLFYQNLAKTTFCDAILITASLINYQLMLCKLADKAKLA